MSIRLSESPDAASEDMPPWARFFIQVGKKAVLAREPGRRISIVTMPCDSPAAGLMCFGAVAAGLTFGENDFVQRHYERLCAVARQYLTACRKCGYRCKPAAAKCGWLIESDGLFEHKSGGRFRATGIQSDSTTNQIQVVSVGKSKNPVTRYVHSRNAWDWHIKGHPVVVRSGLSANKQPALDVVGVHEKMGPPEFGPHEAVLEAAETIERQQCVVTGADVCLVPRIAGKSVAQELFQSCRIEYFDRQRSAAYQYTLAELIKVRDWSPSGNLPRTVIYNPRTEKFDRDEECPLVVADGYGALLATLRTRRLENTHVIGVMSRVSDREDIQELNEKLNGLQQWYEPDPEWLSGVVDLVPGIGVRSLYRGEN